MENNDDNRETVNPSFILSHPLISYLLQKKSAIQNRSIVYGVINLP